MRNPLIFTLFILCTAFTGRVYAEADPVNLHHENMDPFGADALCDKDAYTQSFDLGRFCPMSKIKLYYQFMTPAEATGLNIGSFTTTTSSDYTVYGPFVSVQSGAEQINQHSAPAVVSSSSASTSHSLSFDSEENGIYLLEVTIYSCDGSITFALEKENIICGAPGTCADCIPAFNPPPGKYVLSAWVKEEGALPNKTTYDSPSIEVSFPSAPLTVYTLTPSGQIIDGWQRIESVFEVPGTATDFKIKLQVASANAFFDDIRIFPFDGNVISYVYDPVTLRLLAELDERNYAKIYEYDEEGKLTRVKKETEKGIMTIQENRENSVKKD